MSRPDDCLLEKLDNLVEAIQAQTDAIQNLADSNLMLVQAMAEVDADEEGGAVVQYLDGSLVAGPGAG